jgi:hypothetical protein
MLGVETALVTVAPSASPLLEPLRRLPHLSLDVGNSDQMTTFGVRYSGSHRQLTVRGVARRLTIDDIPPGWRTASAVYLGPVLGECERGLVESLAGASVIVGLQGWLRRVGENGLVEPTITREIADPPRGISAVILSEVDHPEAEAIAASLGARGIVVALTRGVRGATLLWGGERTEIAAAPARELDPTGAGDVFAVVFGLGLHAGYAPADAAERAALAAARVVEGPEMGRLGELAHDLPAAAWFRAGLNGSAGLHRESCPIVSTRGRGPCR